MAVPERPVAPVILLHRSSTSNTGSRSGSEEEGTSKGWVRGGVSSYIRTTWGRMFDGIKLLFNEIDYISTERTAGTACLVALRLGMFYIVLERELLRSECGWRF